MGAARAAPSRARTKEGGGRALLGAEGLSGRAAPLTVGLAGRPAMTAALGFWGMLAFEGRDDVEGAFAGLGAAAAAVVGLRGRG